MRGLIGLLALLYCALAFAGPLPPSNIRVNHLVDPIIDTNVPRFSWLPLHQNRSAFQIAYSIQVKQSTTGIVVWSSGKVMSNALNSMYGSASSAQPLVSDSLYSWVVTWWDQDDQSASSQGYFGTALLYQNDWVGQWIGGDWYGNTYNNMYQDNLLRKVFTIPSGKKATWARAYIAGLGYSELYINGQRVGDYRLDPGWPTYYKRVYYTAYDVSSFLQAGDNAVVVLLGHGWYGSDEIREPDALLSLRFQLNLGLSDGTTQQVISDLTWYGTQSPITFDNIYNGETYDARMENQDYYMPNYTMGSGWFMVQPVSAPGGVMTLMPMEHVEVQEYIYPIKVTQLPNNVYVYDMGQQFSGWCQLQVTGKAGTVVTLIHAEVLFPNGSVNTANLRSAKANDTYILSGAAAGETYEPRFTYHGFRFVQLTASPANGISTPTIKTLTGVHAHSNVGQTGFIQFTEPNPTLNQVQHNIYWSQRSNLMHVPTDCVSRDERKGWMGDASVASEAVLMNFDMPAFYENFLSLIAEDQYPTGALAPTGPWTWGDIGIDPNWMGALPFITYATALYHNDKDLIARFYQNNKLYLNYLVATVQQQGIANLASYGYGDWVPPPPAPKANVSYTSSFSYVLTLKQLIRMAQILGYQSDYEQFTQLASEVVPKFNSVFYNVGGYSYLTGGQTEMSLPLYLGIVEESELDKVVMNLLNEIVSVYNGHLSTGILGTKYLMEFLHTVGRDDIALQLAENVDYPSWGFMAYNNMETPATATWERWDTPFEDGSMNTRNQAMFTSVGSWFYKALGGINIPDENLGSDNATVYIVDPSLEGALAGVTASFTNSRGNITVQWSRVGGPLCGIAAQNYDLTLSCSTIGSSGTIDNIIFASYGTPFGGCTAYGINPQCHAAGSLDIVKKLCVGKASCTIPASANVFGSQCNSSFQHLIVHASCSPNPSPSYTLSASVPVNSYANISIDKHHMSNVTIKEGGVTVWENNSFVKGVDSISSAVPNGNKIVFTTGSGNYTFTASGPIGTFECVTNATQTASLACPTGQTIAAVKFASYGNPSGDCGAYQVGTCNYGSSKLVVETNCLSKNSCQVSLSPQAFGGVLSACASQGSDLYFNAEVVCTSA